MARELFDDQGVYRDRVGALNERLGCANHMMWPAAHLRYTMPYARSNNPLAAYSKNLGKTLKVTFSQFGVGEVFVEDVGQGGVSDVSFGL